MIRYAEFHDLGDVFSLCLLALEELKDVLPFKISEEKLFERIKYFWAQAPCVVFEEDKEIVGFWGLCTYLPFFSEEAALSDYMFYILPEFRSFKAAKNMVEAVKAVADDHGLPLELNYMITEKFDQKTRLFEMMDLQKTGVKGLYKGDV